METSKLNSRRSKITGVIALVFVLQTLVISTNTSTTAHAAADLDISAEAREIERFVDDLFSFTEQVVSLRKKLRLTNAELAAVRSSGEGIKQRIASAQQNIRSVISKMKAANQWDAVEAKVNVLEPGGKSLEVFRRAGGVKKLYEQLANNPGSLAKEIDADVQRLFERVQSQSFSSQDELRSRAVRVAYRPLPSFSGSWRCDIAVGGYNLRIVLLGARFPPRDRVQKRIDRLCPDDDATTATQ